MGAELTSCREGLEEAGFSTDLGLARLGKGKMLVRTDLATRTIEALQSYCRENGELTSSDVVVSQEYKVTLLEQIKSLAPRVNDIAWTQPLQLRPLIEVKSTFIEGFTSSGSSGGVTRSSSD